MLTYRALTREQREAYHAATSTTHRREIDVLLLRRSDGKVVDNLTDRFLGGSVQGDESRNPVTVLEADILDDDHALNWTHGSHRQFEVRVMDSRFVPELDDWVEEAVFTGPLWDFDRQGPVLSIVAEGPEMNALGSVSKAETWPARTKATTVIRELLAAAGCSAKERSIPDLRTTLPRDVTVGVKRGKKAKGKKKDKGPKRRVLTVDREDTYWDAADPIAEALDRDLYGDAWGRFLLRRRPKTPAFVFEDRHLLSPPSASKAIDGEVTNTWIVLGVDPKGPRKRARARVELPKRHPLSAHSLRWNGTPREVIETIENQNIRTNKQARQVGRRHRDRMLRDLTEYQVEALPVIPWLAPGSLMSVPVPGGRAVTRVRQWSLPLGPGPDPLTFGMTHRRRFRR